KRIADALDKAQELIDRRKQQIEMLDEFLQSVFLDMFGDLAENTKQWDVKRLGSVARLQGGYAFKSSDYQSAGIKLVKIANVHRESLDWSEISYLPSEYLDEYSAYRLNEGDVLMAMTRPIIKSLASVKVVRARQDDLPCLLNQRVGRFQIVDPELSHEYLYQFCLSNYFRNEVEKLSSVSLQPNVSSRQISGIPIPLPPREMQMKFKKLAVRLEPQKELMRQSLLEMENAFNSIMQRAFKGELFN
ncbi:MAG: hypothetical protein GX977_08320, partial [Firmicutes bacterium]|nr:hypothetical protein [Bacillota bacterium]